MDPFFVEVTITAIAGLGGAGVVSNADQTGRDPDPLNIPPRPHCNNNGCPVLLGTLLAVIVYLIAPRPADPSAILLTAAVLGFVSGAAGATLSLGIQRFLASV